MVNEEKKEVEKTIVSPVFQLVLIVLSSVIIFTVIFHRLHVFKTTDRRPDYEVITPKKIAQFGTLPAVIQVGLNIDHFQVFDMVRNNFIFSGIIWFKFDPGAISISTLESFVVRRTEILQRSHPDTQLIDNQLLVTYNIVARYTSQLDFTYFPLDGHVLYLTLMHPSLSPQEIIFDSSKQNFIVKAETLAFGWKMLNTDVKTGYRTTVLDEFDPRTNRAIPIAIFSIEYLRTGIRYILSIILPLLLIFYLGLFSFSIRRGSVTFTAVCVTALISYRFVIENISPSVGYFMLSDYLYFSFLTATFLIFLCSIINEYIAVISLMVKKALLVIFHTLINTIILYLLLIWT
jgi:hypothetical protein